jgi:hypothetical protein
MHWHEWGQIYFYPSSMDVKICVCLPCKYGRFILFIDNNLLLPSARLHILNNIYRKWLMNRSEVSSKWNKCRIYGTNSRKCYMSKLALKWQRFCLIGKPNMFFPSFLNRFSYFMNLWWCLWSFSVDIIQDM